MGFFPTCPNHNLPMLLKNGQHGVYWYCDTNDCAHTQNFLGAARRVEAINGRSLAVGATTNSRAMARKSSSLTSKVEEKAVRHVDEEQG